MRERFLSALFFIILSPAGQAFAQTRAVNAFYYATEIVADSKGNLFVGGKNNKIIKITPDRRAYHFAGHPKGNSQSKDGPGGQAMFYELKGLAIDKDDNIYVADYNTIRKITPAGFVTTYLGNANKPAVTDGDKNTAAFRKLGAIATDRSGVIYVTDEIFDEQQKRTFNIIRKVSPAGDVTTIKNNDGTILRAHSIRGLICDNEGNLYVSAVAWSSDIKKITPEGTITTITGVYNEDPKKRAYFKEGDLRSARIVSPHSLAISPGGEIFFSDSWLNRILKISNNQLIVVAGGGGESADGVNFMSGSGGGGYADGKAKQALFRSTAGITFDKQGNLLIVDASSNSHIRMLSNGMVSTYLKQSYNSVTKQYEDDNSALVTIQPAKNTETETPATPLKQLTDSLMNDPRLKKIISEAKALNIDSLKRAMAAMAQMGGAGSPGKDTGAYILPEKNIKALAKIPKQVLSASELQSYAGMLYKKLAPAFHAAYGTPLVNTTGYDANTLSNSSALAIEKGHLDQAILLSLKAVEKNPDDPAALNNAGAILKKGGLEIAAVTILEAANQKDPNNSTIHNNLGQAYLRLGEKGKAEQYLKTAVANSPYHPLANSSLALVNYTRGNKDAALRYTENSLRGAFTDKAWHLLYKLKKDAVLMDYFRHRYQQPEYFNEDKYKLPEQCESVSAIPGKKGEYQAYREMLSRAKANFEAIADTELKLGQESVMLKARQGKIVPAPFMQLAAAMMLDLKIQMDKDGGPKIAKAQKEYKRKIHLLHDQYKETLKNHHSCGDRIALANEYMGRMSNVTRDYQKAYLRIYKDFYHDMTYWGFFSNSDPHIRKANFCRMTASLLGVLLGLAVTHFLEDFSIDCASVEEKNRTADEIKIEGHCPIGEDGFEIPFGIGKFNISCDKWDLEVGEAVVLNVGHKFYTGETTWALGPGVSVSLIGSGHESLKSVPQLKAGPIQPGLAAGIKGQIFLTFRNGQVLDWGGLFETELDLLGVAKEFKTGYTIGVNSGLDMEQGSLKNVIDKALGPDGEAPQINKNVKPYKPK